MADRNPASDPGQDGSVEDRAVEDGAVEDGAEYVDKSIKEAERDAEAKLSQAEVVEWVAKINSEGGSDGDGTLSEDELSEGMLVAMGGAMNRVGVLLEAVARSHVQRKQDAACAAVVFAWGIGEVTEEQTVKVLNMDSSRLAGIRETLLSIARTAVKVAEAIEKQEAGQEADE